jgi:hypothetical protein
MPELTTQQFLEIEDIREGALILKDKSLRGVFGGLFFKLCSKV